MNPNDLRRLFLGPTLFRLDTVLSPRLVPVLYALGLCGLLVWAINHLFFTFGSNFGNGLWGLLEILVFGLLGLVVLRVACEALLIFFKAHEGAGEAVSRARLSSTLLEEVKDAIHDLADDDDEIVPATDVPPYTPSVQRSARPLVATKPIVRGPAVKRSAKRTPPSKT
jgi:hypothetical protein